MKHPHYVIRVEGHLGGTWSDWFGGLEIRDERDQDRRRTIIVLSGMMDQAALHSTLNKIRELGLRLLSVQVIEQKTDRRKT